MSMNYETIISQRTPPPCSMIFNGIQLEEAIPGYMTHEVTGRDSLSTTINELNAGKRDGAIYHSRNHSTRELTVTFGLTSNNVENHRKNLDKLRGILYATDTEECKIIFGDEPDIYYVGTVSSFSESKSVVNNSSTGEIKIRCSDPFKYSVEEFVVSAVPGETDNRFLINYDGTYKSYPVLVSKFAQQNGVGEDISNVGDCGYVAWMNDRNNVIQLGDPDETDNDSRTHSISLIDQKFTSFDHTVTENWDVNEGVNTNHTISADSELTSAVFGGGSLLTPASYGSSSPGVNEWHGPSLRRIFSSGDNWECENWRCQWKTYFAICYDYLAQVSSIEHFYILLNHKDEKNPPSTADAYVEAHWDNQPHNVSSEHKYLWHFMKVTYSNNTVTKFAPRVIADYTGFNINEVKHLYATNMHASAPYDAAFDEEIKSTDKANKHLWEMTVVSYQDKTENDKTKQKDDTKSKKLLIDTYQEKGKPDQAKVVKQRGIVQVTVAQGTDQNAELIACLSIVKDNNSTDKAHARFYLKGVTTVDVGPFDITEFNQYFGWTKKENGKTISTPTRTCEIAKKGNDFTFTIPGPNGGKLTRTLTSATAAAMTPDNVTIWFGTYGETPVPVTLLGIEYLRFKKDHYATYKDIPNKFGMNDICEADCGKAEIRLNDMPMPSLGAVGNDWEEFCLYPGLNDIAVAYSDWVDSNHKPEFEIRYRKVYI